MGRKARRIQRAFDERKQPNEKKVTFVERKVRELEQMDEELAEAMRGNRELQGP
jgi:hypothetical protein